MTVGFPTVEPIYALSITYNLEIVILTLKQKKITTYLSYKGATQRSV